MSDEKKSLSPWMKRTYIAFLLVAVFIFGPIVFCEGPGWYKKGYSLYEATMQKANGSENAAPAAPAAATVGLPELPEEPKVDIRTHQLEQVFRFDVSPRWVMDNWPRVTTSLGHLAAQGYRVSLVTGTDRTDIAGSLTYFFDPKQRVDRITFQGKTGDPTRLIRHLKQRFKFTREIANDPGLFLWEAPAKSAGLQSYLHVRTSNLIQSTDQFQKYDVALVIIRPQKS